MAAVVFRENHRKTQVVQRQTRLMQQSPLGHRDVIAIAVAISHNSPIFMDAMVLVVGLAHGIQVYRAVDRLQESPSLHVEMDWL